MQHWRTLLLGGADSGRCQSPACSPAARPRASPADAAFLPCPSCPSCPALPCPAAAKADRLKQAKDEAEREIGAFKAEREAEFRRKVRPHCDKPSPGYTTCQNER